MAYDKTTDLESVQADVLTTDTADNTKISKLKQLKTENKVITKAINALNDQLGNAQASASDALQSVVNMDQRVTAVETDLADVKTDVATLQTTRSNGAQNQSDNQSLTPMGTITTEQNTNLTVQLLRLLGKDILKYESTSGEYYQAPVVDGKLVVSTGEDIKKYVPTQIDNVEFTNILKPEDKVDLIWNLNDVDTSTPGDYITTATYPQGYCSTVGAFPYINVHVKATTTNGVYGIVFIENNSDNSGDGKWMRINSDGEPVHFDASAHGTWSGIHEVTSAGQPMVEIPTTWVKRGAVDTGMYEGKQCWWIADHEIEGFHVHPAFLKRDGSVGNLRISKYLCSKGDDDVPVIADKGFANGVTPYWTKVLSTDLGTYADKLNTGTGEHANWRPCCIYDVHFLEWMIFTENRGPNLYNNVLSNQLCTGKERMDYYGIIDPLGLPNAGNGYWIYGFNTAGGTLNVLRNNGSMEMVNTGLPCATSNSPCIVNMRTEAGDGYDFSDLFVISADDYTNSSRAKGNFSSSSQTLTSDRGFVIKYSYTSTTVQSSSNSTSYSAVALFHMNPLAIATVGTTACWRLAQVI